MGKSNVERFSDRAEAYARYRPGYPAALVELLAREAQLGPESVVVDIGSGTGLSSLPFLEAGYTVYGVEPNAPMRTAAEAALCGRYPTRFRSIDGRAEATTLPDGCADLIVAGTAFHWFDRAATAAEFRRIGKHDPTVVALFWNRRDDEASPFMAAYEELLLRHVPEYAGKRAIERGRESETVWAFLGEGCKEAHFPHTQLLDFEGLVGRVGSSSYVPAPGSAAFEELRSELRVLFALHANEGVVAFAYDTSIYYEKV